MCIRMNACAINYSLIQLGKIPLPPFWKGGVAKFKPLAFASNKIRAVSWIHILNFE